MVSKLVQMMGFLRTLGPLRLMLAFLTLTLVVLAPDADVREQREGWALVTTVVVPALSPMVLMVLFLDALMSRVWMADRSEAGRLRYRRILWLDLALGLLLVIAFIPYFSQLVR
jgi:hypothetical protein